MKPRHLTLEHVVILCMKHNKHRIFAQRDNLQSLQLMLQVSSSSWQGQSEWKGFAIGTFSSVCLALSTAAVHQMGDAIPPIEVSAGACVP